jgi:hypothetical protein
MSIKKQKCIVDGCNRSYKILKHQLCPAHLVRFYRTGRVGDSLIRKKTLFNKYTPGKNK